MRLDRNRAALVVVDVQEAFRPVLPDFESVAKSVGKLVQGAEAMGVPMVVTEQYPQGLGSTAPEVAEHLPEGLQTIEKVCFDATEADGFALDGRDQAVVCGIETHVCVNQTVHGLLDEGVQVHVVVDGVGSRTDQNRELGLHRAEQAGAVLTSVETALFELLRGSDAPEFKQVQALVK